MILITSRTNKENDYSGHWSSLRHDYFLVVIYNSCYRLNARIVATDTRVLFIELTKPPVLEVMQEKLDEHSHISKEVVKILIAENMILREGFNNS